MFDEHVTDMARKAQVHLVCQLSQFLDQWYLLRVTHVLFMSILDYCNALYVGLHLRSIQELQLVQNVMA